MYVRKNTLWYPTRKFWQMIGSVGLSVVLVWRNPLHGFHGIPKALFLPARHTLCFRAYPDYPGYRFSKRPVKHSPFFLPEIHVRSIYRLLASL